MLTAQLFLVFLDSTNSTRSFTVEARAQIIRVSHKRKKGNHRGGVMRTNGVIFNSCQSRTLTRPLGGIEEPSLGCRDEANDECPIGVVVRLGVGRGFARM